MTAKPGADGGIPSVATQTPDGWVEMQRLDMEGTQTLNLGSGRDLSVPDATTVDINPDTNPDVLHDLNHTPWPFDDDVFGVIYCKDIIEHLDDVVKTMEEIHRIARNGATVYITTPHFSCSNSYTDPTHRQRLGLFSFDYFTDQSKWSYYTRARFSIVKRKLFFHPGLKNAVVWRIANTYPSFYEEHLTWLFPAWFMSFELEAVK